MATWHQMKARRRAGRAFDLRHQYSWRVVNDPPGEMAGVQSFRWEFDARQYLARHPTHNYLLAPRYIHEAEAALETQGL